MHDHRRVTAYFIMFAVGLIACICGSGLRLILEFTLPKDRSLVAFGEQQCTAVPAVCDVKTSKQYKLVHTTDMLASEYMQHTQCTGTSKL